MTPINLNARNTKVEDLLIDQLNLVFCTKAHRIERLQEIVDHSKFADLKRSMNETIVKLENGVVCLTEIFTLLKKDHSFDNCSEIVSILDGYFISLQRSSDDRTLRNLLLVSYISLAESIETNSFNILNIIFKKLDDENLLSLINKNIEAANFEDPLLNLVLDEINN